MITAIIFDMDGLLIDSEPIWRSVQVDVFGSLGVQLTEEMCVETTGVRIDQVVRYRCQKHNITGLIFDEIEALILAGVQKAIRERSVLMPGAIEAIEYARGNGWKTAIASSSPQILIDAVLSRFKLHDRFEATHSAQFEAAGKPHPAVYLSTAKQLGVSPSACLAVEDSSPGVKAAKAAGMLCCAVPDLNADRILFEAADVVIDSLNEFQKVVETLLNTQENKF